MKKTGEQPHNYFHITKQRVRQQELENGGGGGMDEQRKGEEGREVGKIDRKEAV